jgi:hypothetical protein
MGPTEILKRIAIANPNASSFRIDLVQPGKLFQQRAGRKANGLRKKAVALSSQIGCPFMDAVTLTITKEQKCSGHILRHIMFQNTEDNGIWVSRENVLAGAVDEIFARRQNDGMNVISSLVSMRDGSFGHIPMMDFWLKISKKSDKLAQQVSSAFRVGPGWVLRSGRSYHFYGQQIIDKSTMMQFLGTALMFAPITDRGWIAHQLVDCACNLRAGEHETKIGSPYVIGKVK